MTDKKKKIMNLPNTLTLSRMFMIPVFILFFYMPFMGHYFVALGVFIIASLTDMLDGYIARKCNLITNMGKFLDPIADKVLVLSAFVIFITVPEIVTYELGMPMIIIAGTGVVVILAREIIVSGFRLVASDAGCVIAADIFGKYKTVTQYMSIVSLLFSIGLTEFISNDPIVVIIHYIGLAVFGISIILTVISGANYIIRNIDVLRQ